MILITICIAQTVDDVSSSEQSIAYTISIFSIAQMKKEAKKRGDAKSISLELSSNLEWDTFKAKILSKVDSILKPASISFDDYIVTFTIPRIHPKATSLDDEDAYKFMIGRASKSKDPNAAINIEPIIPNEVCFSIDFRFIFALLLCSCIFRFPMMKRRIKVKILVALRVRVITERRRGRGEGRERKKRHGFVFC
jgi:hypothetical protein